MSDFDYNILKETEHLIDEINFEQINNKTVLITGASGLIGVHFLCTIKNLVINKKYKVNVIGIHVSELSEQFKQLFDFEGCNMIQGDITDFNFLNSLPKVDYVIHAAGYGQPNKFMDDQVKTLKLNTFSTFELIKKVKEQGKFLFLSSSEVYSGLDNSYFNESQIGNTSPEHPRACYIDGKKCGETIVNLYRNIGIDAKSARLSLAYGPGVKLGDKRALNSFIEKALYKDIDLMDEGKSLRTYCYVTDVVYIMWKILLEGKYSVYNVGGISKMSIKELADTIANELNVKTILPETTQPLIGAPENVSIDMTRFEEEFGKINYTPFSDGIKKTINWYKQLYYKK